MAVSLHCKSLALKNSASVLINLCIYLLIFMTCCSPKTLIISALFLVLSKKAAALAAGIVSLNFLIKNTLPIVLVEFVKILESKVLKALLIFSSLAFIL